MKVSVASQQQDRTFPISGKIRDVMRRAGGREAALIPVLALAITIGAFVSPAFLTPGNLIGILQQAAALSLVVLAQTIILIAGKFDLSQESVVGFAPMAAAVAMLGGLPPLLGLVLCLAIGAVIGAGNGFLVVRLRLNAFIVTLAVLILVRGLTLAINDGRTVVDLPESFVFLGSARFLGIPVSVILVVLIYIVVGVILRYHRIGRAIYAIGGNARAAKAAGIRVERVVWGAFIFGGLMAALAGILLAGRLESTSAVSGQNMIFTVFAACVIGGVSLNGGAGSLVGAVLGVLVLGVFQNILTLSQVSSFFVDASFGAIILIALIVTRFTSGEESE